MKFRSVCLITVFALLLVVLGGAPLASAGPGPAAAAPQAAPAVALSGVKMVATGGSHACAISQSDGSVSCWGANGSGQVGDGTGVSRDLPVRITALGTGVLDIAAGAAHTCAVTSAGALKCWGSASEGQLGDGQRGTNRLAPVQVSGLTSGVKAVAAGAEHTCAVMTDGTVKCWGKNDKYQMGDGTTTARLLTPQTVPGLSGVAAIAAGAKHNCALLASGGLKCWGANLNGQVGNGSTSDFSAKTPQDVIGMQAGVADVAAGDSHTCASMVTGDVKCWGANTSGQLGIGNTVGQSEPVKLDGISAKRVTAGSSFSCAVRSDETVSCWGDNTLGQLGNGGSTGSTSPAAVAGVTGATDVAGGSVYTCALSGGALRCWGDNSNGQLATGDLIYRGARGDIAAFGPVSALSAGYGNSCAITSAGEVSCWGANMTGQLGDGARTGSGMPKTVAGLNGATDVAVGGFHACAIVGFNLRCWGNNERGQVGDGSFEKAKLSPVSLPIYDASDVAAGFGHTCVVATGGVKCWGQGTEGQIGNGQDQHQYTPVAVTGLAPGSSVTAVGAGVEHTCALLNTGAVKCWGKNDKGQLGNGTTNNSNVPVDVSGIATARALTVGGAHACVLLQDNSIKCWGANDKGQLGDGSTDFRSTPVTVPGLPAIKTVAAGGPHTCAAADGTGALYCWGNGGYGELGNWDFDNETRPVLVRGASAGVTAVALGMSHTCAELNDSAVACWGWDGFGQLGQGTVSPRLSPAAAQASMPPTLSVTPPANGKPGSTFLLTGHRFGAGDVLFSLNGADAGTYATGSGSFVVVLDTAGNAAGRYNAVAAQSGPGSATASITLSESLPLRQVTGGSVAVSAPSAQPLVMKNIYLPTIRR